MREGFVSFKTVLCSPGNDESAVELRANICDGGIEPKQCTHLVTGRTASRPALVSSRLVVTKQP